MNPSKNGHYNYIVDEAAHAKSEAFDLPYDMEQLQLDLPKTEPGTIHTLTRPVTENECKAYGIEEPETAFAMLSLDDSEPREMYRMIYDNSSGQFNSMLACPERFFLDYHNNQKSDKSFAVAVAYFIGACQGREGFEFDDNCIAVKKELRSPGLVPKLVNSIVHHCLLQPKVNLNKVVEEIDLAMTGAILFVAENLAEYPLLNETLTELADTLNQHGLSVDSETAARWIKFCGKRIVWCDFRGSLKEHARLNGPVFQDIDKAVKDHMFFSALVYEPADLQM